MVLNRAVFIIGILLLMPALVFSQAYMQDVGTGKVDWTTQNIRATGIGAPNVNLPLPQQRAGALRAARNDALRVLIETVKGINLNSETLVENAIVTSDQIRTKVEGAIRGFRIVDTRYMSSGDVEVDVEVPLTGILSDAILPPLQAFGGSGMPAAGGEAASETPTAGGAVSGLIVDARGLGLRPAMAPKVVDEQGNEVYGSKFVSREYAVDIGMVGYEKDINRAAKNDRVASTPMVVKGLQASGPNKTDVVVGAADAAKIQNTAVNANFRQHCKVMFVLD
jgi:hypothetical protein